MTDQTTGKTAQLTPEEWKQLCLLNVAQLQNFLQGIPGNAESGASGVTDQHMAMIDTHLLRGRQFLRAWSLAKAPGMAVAQASAPAAPVEATANGADPEKRKGGWPLGKKRVRKVKAEPQVTQ